MKITEGSRSPLGASLTKGGVNFAVFSAAATSAWVCLYDDVGAQELARFELAPVGDGVFCAEVAGLGAGARYGLRMGGPFEPQRGFRFDRSKLLADPYGALLDRPYVLHATMFEFGADSGPHAPKNIVPEAMPPTPPFAGIPWSRTIIYELNLRAFTRLNSEIPAKLRGRFAGLAHPAAIAHLKSLGVTSVEIMPADAFVDERHLPPLGLTNAWGYNPVVYGAPDPRLAPDGWAEVRVATAALHEAGMEVLLDVVINHNGESDEFGPTLSLRGLDNSTYFRLLPDDPSRYVNDMGCGNCVALERGPVMDMALAGLRRWMLLGGIDGFRFDLAPALGRRENRFDPQAPFFGRLAQDAVLARAKMIAEPWDIGPGGYGLGRFPDSWSEWNDRFRDTTRRFWRGDAGQRADLATRLAGSGDIFGQGRAPSRSINFIAAHDGFTLADLVAYGQKHNEANGEDNRDGSNENYSWNNGVEGPSADKTILAARARDQRNLLVTLMMARGAPMLSMGAELGHSQQGNNNAYAQDNAISWIDWSKADATLIAFTQKLTALRAAHPALNADVWLKGQPNAHGLPDVEWRDANGSLSEAQWRDPAGRTLVVILAASDAQRVAIILHSGGEDIDVHLPEARASMGWRLALDSADDARFGDLAGDGESLRVRARSAAILVEGPGGRPAGSRRADAATLDALAGAAGLWAEWWDVAGNHAIVSAPTKMALLAALRLPAQTRDDARDSLHRLIEDTSARHTPHSLALRAGAPLGATIRVAPDAAERPLHVRIETEQGEFIERRGPLSGGRSLALADGRQIVEGRFDLPDLPEGRHRLFVDDVACALTIAPRRAYMAPGLQRKRLGFAAQLYAIRRAGADQGIGDFTTLGDLAQAAAKAGAATLGVNPLHAMFPRDRQRVSPYQPSDRRYLDPLSIDVIDDDGLPSDEIFRSALGAQAGALAQVAASPMVAYEDVWRLKQSLLEARIACFERARRANPQNPIFADYDDFIVRGGLALMKFAAYQTHELENPNTPWMQWTSPLRNCESRAVLDYAKDRALEINGVFFGQWLARRQLRRAGARAKAAGLDLGFYADLAVGAAPDGAESWSRQDELAQSVSIGAPPDPFSAAGQIWNLPAPDPFACARGGWAGLAEIFAANMRDAGLLRIDHAMGLTRLFLVPDGGKPADGTYLAYPRDELFGQIALESQRHQCMVIGEDLGTVPDGFRDAMEANGLMGMRVLYFERSGQNFLPPANYPAASVACATTHDLPTLAGWWSGADIGERLNLGLLALDAAQTQIATRSDEKRALAQALQHAGLLTQAPDFTAALSDDFAHAVYGFLAGAGSLIALAQMEDLASETIAANLPGTDRERANWRRRLSPALDDIFASPRAKAIIAGLSAGRA